MNFDRKTVVLLALIIFGFTAYNYYLQSKYPDFYAGRGRGEVVQPQSEGSNVAAKVSGNESATASETVESGKSAVSLDENASINRLSPEELTFDTPTRTVVFNQDRVAITSVKLKGYQAERNSEEPVELLDGPLTIQAITNVAQRVGEKGFAAERQGQSMIYRKKRGDFEITQKLTVPDSGYMMPVEVSFKNTSKASQELTAGLLMQEAISLDDSGGSFFNPASFVAMNKSLIYGLDGGRNEEVAQSYCEDDANEPAFSLRSEKVDYIGYNKHYFLSVIWPDNKMNFVMEHSDAESRTEGSCPVSLIAYDNQGFVEPGAEVKLSFSAYLGPKDLDILEAASPELKSSVKFGWFSVIAKPLLFIVKWLYDVFQNYGLAIILVTVLLKILFYPLTKAAAVSMKKMQKLQPEMTKLREKFKDDPQRQQRELMMFMAKHKVNPAKGCLPILPQIPVFIAFYNVLSQAIELRHATFFGWIQDLSSADPYYVTPILLGCGMFLQQKLTPNPSMDKNQERIMLMMPLIFTVMMLSLPAGMVLYMITNTAVSIVQQQWLNRKLAKQLG